MAFLAASSAWCSVRQSTTTVVKHHATSIVSPTLARFIIHRTSVADALSMSAVKAKTANATTSTANQKYRVSLVLFIPVPRTSSASSRVLVYDGTLIAGLGGSVK
ncbi:hypothetical protein RvY_13656 [Ramazzottius varieornatus]|uniref:Uncharacterized protein n=1 Tax=Ramazzottius varieornatus TaxID=947166 RepID=A0A1D1VQU0_RAMVA|nr:hypothetical protein RvY_13656 [Ramazzottius varieornatus]